MKFGAVANVLMLMCLMLLEFDSADHRNITAVSGENVTLPCRAPNNNITVVEWSRPDLDPVYVFVLRNDNYDPHNQHPSFKNRVEWWKNGDVFTLTLKNVTINDTGTYEGRVLMGDSNSWNICVFNLRVIPPGQPGGHTEDGGKEDGVGSRCIGLVASLSLSLGAVLVGVGLQKN